MSDTTIAKRWVVKIGSSLLTNDGQGLDLERITGWVNQIAELKKAGVEIVLVSSGAVAAGMTRLGWTQRPTELEYLQAAAAVGQTSLVQCYEDRFQVHGIHTAQILLTHDDLADRRRYLNARNSLRTMLGLNVIPVVNENDTVVTDEIRFGDNDTLGALVANLIEAERLVILTDQSGLYTADPRSNPDARLIETGRANDMSLEAMASGAGKLGQGGMITKVRAARFAARSGAETVICAGKENNVLARLFEGESIGTKLVPDQEPLLARKQWLAGHLQAKGKLVLDDGAIKALTHKGTSLLSVGVAAVEGEFSRGELVICEDVNGNQIAKGLINYNAFEAAKICRKTSAEIETALGYVSEPELIHRDNLVVL